MVVLSGKNLGERQRELNTKVAEVVVEKKNFNEIKAEKETTDIDKLYKIDIASQYKDIDYIIEILKSGDAFYITRALKSIWLYEDSYSHIMNPDNLHENIFPLMSIKMKKKLLSTISMHIKNKERAATFYLYCMKNKLSSIGIKFLIKTSIEFKLNGDNLLHYYSYTPLQLKYFVDNSFELAIALFNIQRSAAKSTDLLHNLRYLYCVSNENYLDMLEKYEFVDFNYPNSLRQLGIRTSKDIMVKHKNRILEKPLLYVNKLNRNMLIKYSTADDAKAYIAALMPPDVDDIWKIDFYNSYKYILNLIPNNERWTYVKQTFNSRYPGKEFEMNANFYHFKYYEMLSTEERELWALHQLEVKKEIFGIGNDYIWYKFVNVDKALTDLKKIIMRTPDNYTRLKIIQILVESARDQNDLLKVLNYFNERHRNELEDFKCTFITKVLDDHNVFEMDLEIWQELNKIFHSLQIYTVGNYNNDKSLMAASVCFHILHKITLPQALIDFVDLDINYSYFCTFLEKLGKDKCDTIFQFLLNLFVEKLEPFHHDPHNKKLRNKLRQYVHNITNLYYTFHKDENDRPEIVTRFLNIDSPKTDERKKITAEDLYRLLKVDSTLVVDALSHYNKNIEELPHRLNRVLRKLRIYFSNDVAQEYIIFFERWLPQFPDNYNSYKLISVAIYGIFQLADNSLRVALMEKYCPSDPKIDHGATDRKLLYIQEAICRLVGYSRPPVPLEIILKYLRGDYTQYCLPIFNMYAVNLPLPLALKFTEATLNTPLSVQKQGLRLAFKFYEIEQLKNLVLKVWKNTKNVSLRMIIYTTLFDKITKEDDDAQIVLYEALKHFTSNLNEDDHDDVFRLLSSDQISAQLLGDHLRTSWDMVNKLPLKNVNINRQIAVIYSIASNIDSVGREFVLKCIIESHIHETLDENRLRPHEVHEINELRNSKWDLTAKYISLYDNSDELNGRLELLKSIFKKCLDMWNETYKNENNHDIFQSQKFYFEFIINIKDTNVRSKYKNSWSYNVPILECILDMLITSLPLKEIYTTVWDLKLTITSRVTSSDADTTLYERGENFKPLSPEDIAASFAKQIGILLQDLKEKHQFYVVFLQEMANSINTNVNEIQKIFKYFCKTFNLMFCKSLADIGMKETHLIALMLLPSCAPNETRETLSKILRKIQAFEDDEVQSYLHFKFVQIDYQNRLNNIEY